MHGAGEEALSMQINPEIKFHDVRRSRWVEEAERARVEVRAFLERRQRGAHPVEIKGWHAVVSFSSRAIRL